MKNFKVFKLLFILPLFLLLPRLASADECVYQFAAKDPSGEFISGIRFELFAHTKDVLGRSKPGTAIASGVTDKILGKAIVKFDCEKKPEDGLFAVKVKNLSNDISNFWYYYRPTQQTDPDEVNADINYVVLSGLRVVFRDGDGNLKKNVSFNLYTQKYDADENPIKEKKDLLGSFNTGETGVITIFVPQGSARSIDRKIGDNYVIEIPASGGAKFVKYYLSIKDGALTAKDYIYSGLKFILKDGQNKIYPEKTAIEIYRQEKDINQTNNLGAKVGSASINDQGEAIFEYPEGLYAAVVKDSLGKQNIFWDLEIQDEVLSSKTLKTNLTKITISNEAGEMMAPGTKFKLYDLKETSPNVYYQGSSLYSGSLGADGYTNLSLRPGVYQVVYSYQPKGGKLVNYGLAFKAKNDSAQTINLRAVAAQEITAGQAVKIGQSFSRGSDLANRLRGKILLQVEKNGEAWYINHADLKRYYLANGTEAYKVMRFLGVGVKTADLNKIPVGLRNEFNQNDSDGDGLGDKLEEALGTNAYNKNTDGDAYDDADEVRAGFNPLGSGNYPLNTSFANQQKGKILLQVESRGEAWYVNPADGKRYYLADGAAAYAIMRYLSLGATNENIEPIDEGVLGDL